MEHPFKKLGLNDQIVDVVKQLYFKEPTEIQHRAIPAILQGTSIIGQSQTGSGKTHAFLLPLFHALDLSKKEVQAVITAPTRELATQLFEEIKMIRKLLGKDEAINARLIIGGLDRERMIRQLSSTTPHIVVGTPGRILDMVDEGVLSIYRAKSFVIDEADLMLDLKFIDKIDALLVRSKKDVQILVFSATIPTPLEEFLRKFLRQPLKINIENRATPVQLEQRLIEVKKGHRVEDYLEEVSNTIQPYVAIVFANSKERVEEIGHFLSSLGKNVGVLHGDLSSRERMRVVKAIHQLQYEYIVATDLASRGIDIKGASHVINVELPKEREFYIHRVGRTARAGGEGLAISFYTEEDERLLEQLEKQGIPLIYTTIKKGQLVEAEHRDARRKRHKTDDAIERLAWQRVKKPKKVKPGYKKKMVKEKEKIKRQLLKKTKSKRGRGKR